MAKQPPVSRPESKPRVTGSQAFGDYRLERRVAQGGMAEAWKARRVGAAGVQKQVLIKRIKTSVSSDPKFVQMFISEAHVSASLSHGNIAQVFDFGEVQGEYYLAMEFIDGPSLAQLIKKLQELDRPKVPPPLALFIAMEMCKGLHYAHVHRDEQGNPVGIVHRDVSPENVLLSYEGQVKLIDFGIAKARVAARLETEAGIVRGKYLYFSPEQSRGEQVDPLTDVWAVGVVLYFMLCGRLPITGQAFEVIRRLQFGEFPKPTVVVPELSEELEGVVLKALSLKKNDRYRSAQHFHDAMGEILHRDYPGISSAYLAAFLAEVFASDLESQGKQVDISAPVAEGLKAMKTGQTKSRRFQASVDSAEALRSAAEVAAATPAPQAAPMDPVTKRLVIALISVLVVGVVLLGVAISVLGGQDSARTHGDDLRPNAPDLDPWNTKLAREIAKLKARPATPVLQLAMHPLLDRARKLLDGAAPDAEPALRREVAFIDAALGGAPFTGDERVQFDDWLVSQAELLLAQDNFDAAMALLDQCQSGDCTSLRDELTPIREPFSALMSAASAMDDGDFERARLSMGVASELSNHPRYKPRFEQLAGRWFNLYAKSRPANSLPQATPPDFWVQPAKEQKQFVERFGFDEKAGKAKGAAFLKSLAIVKKQVADATTPKAVEHAHEQLSELESQLPPRLTREERDTEVDSLLSDVQKFTINRNWDAARSQLKKCLIKAPRHWKCQLAGVELYQVLKNAAAMKQHAQKYLEYAPVDEPRRKMVEAMLRP